MGKYHFANEDTLALSYYDRTRFPTLKERYTTSKPAYNQIAIVNPQLKPERARGVDLTRMVPSRATGDLRSAFTITG